MTGRSLALACGVFLAAAGAASAQDDPAPVVLSVRETLDVWRNAQGGLARGDVVLNKLQAVGTLDGAAFGLPGFRAQAQVFATDGASLTAKVGDLQTVSNIEAVNTARLFEAWIEQRFGATSLRLGLIDLNGEFDSIDPAGLFIDSSHGIGPDLSKSGLDGPSIFPVSSAGVRWAWTPSARWTVRAAVFDGVSGDPAHPKAFVAARLAGDDGALLISQVDFRPHDGLQLSLGAWRYTGTFDRLDGAMLRQRGNAGVYGFVEGPLPGDSGWSGWIRAGVADPAVQVVSGYLGAGVVAKAPFGRSGDQFGLAVSHAAVGSPARRTLVLAAAETTLEATYLLALSGRFAIQPDLQYVIHPSTRPGLKNALAIGLRLTLTAGYPAQAP